MKTPPEIALAIDCTRIHPDQSAIHTMRSRIEAGVNWAEFVRFAIPHGILPLAAHNLGLYAADLTPQATLDQLQRVLARARLRHGVQSAALALVTRAFIRERLHVLLYKGPALIALAYPDPGLREFHDLDLWTAPGDMASAGDILRGLGYQPSRYEDGHAQPSSDLGEEQNEFVSANGAVVIDLQNLELHPQFSFCPEFAALWERRALLSIAGATVATLGTEDLLPALAVHGSKHLWRRLNWVVDVSALLAASPHLDWDATIRQSLQWRCHRRLLSALAMQTILYGTVLPPEVAARIRRQGDTLASATQAVRRILDTPAEGTLRNAVSVFHHHYRCTDHARDRMAIGRAEFERRFNRGRETGARLVRGAVSRLFRKSDLSSHSSV